PSDIAHSFFRRIPQSVAILDVDTLFALADVGSGAGRAVVFWAALAIVAAFLGLLGYVIATILTEGRQQAIVLRALGNMASVLTTVAFMPASSLLLAVFHECRSVNALGVTCNTDGHWIVIALVVIVLTVFTAVSTFFASVYIDTDLTSTALGAKVTGRVDAVMLVAKLVLVACFTTMDLPPSLQVILAGVAALLWLLGTLFAQPHVQPLANNLATAAAALNAWLVLAVATQLVAPEAGIDALLVVGMVVAPMLGYFANVTYVGAVAGSDFASLRSSLQADIWARRRVALAQRLQANSQHSGAGRHGAARAGSQGGAAVSKRPGRRDSPVRGQSYGRTASQAGAPARGELPMSARGGVRAGRTGKPVGHAASLASLLGDRPGSVDGGELVVAGPRAPMRIQVFADNGPEAGRESAAEPATTGDLLPGVTSEALIEQASMAYDEMLKAWPKSAVTYASGSIFHRAYGSTVSSELTILAMARKQVGSAWDVSFLSYQRTRQLQERSASGLSAVDRILFDEAWTTAIDETTKAFAAQNKLYNHAVESNPDAHRIGKLAEELFKARSAAERKFRTMLQINPDSTTALRAYSRFCDDVLGDAERATELMNKANRIEEKHAKTNIKPLDAVIIGSPEEPLSVMDEMNAVITMTGELRRYGEITDANVATARLFGRGRSDLVGQSLASLFPEPLGSLYDAAILAYLSPHEKGEAFSRGAHVSVVQTAGGWLAPVRVSLQESAGSELDATPCLSMVVQRAPTKRRMFLVGEAVAGFPVLALDAESLAMLGDDSLGDSGDNEGAGELGSGEYDSDIDDASVANPFGQDRAITSAAAHPSAMRASLTWGQGTPHLVQPSLPMVAGGAAQGATGQELLLVQWLPDLARLAAAAIGSAAGAQAELTAVGTMFAAERLRDEDGFPDLDAGWKEPLRGQGESGTERMAGDQTSAFSSAAVAAKGQAKSSAPTSSVAKSAEQAAARHSIRQARPYSAASLDSLVACSAHDHGPDERPCSGRGQKPGRSPMTGQLHRENWSRPVRLRVGMQALHPGVLAGRRPAADGPAPPFWLVSWEPPRSRAASSAPRAMPSPAAGIASGLASGADSAAAGHSPSAMSGPVALARGSAASIQNGRRPNLRAPAQSRRSNAGNPLQGSAARTRSTLGPAPREHCPDALLADGSAPSPISKSCAAGKDSQAEPANKGTAAAADTSAGEHGMFIGIPDAPPDKSEAPDVGDAAGTARLLPGHESAMSALAKVQLDQATVSGGNGSVTSGLGSASRITKLILDTSLAKSDPMVWRVGAVVIGSLVAVITFAVALAVVLPISNADARLLVIANDLAQRRLYHSDSASNAWYQLVSVSFGFTAVNDWATLTTNLTESIDRMEAAHRELLSISQTVQGDLFDFELERMWDTCTESLVLYDCSKHEVMSATDLVEFTIYQLRQMAAEQPTTIITSPSFLTNVPNINLMALALREAEHTSATELANGMRQRLDMMTNVLVAAALLTFALATLGTTILMASIGRHRYRMLSSIPQISRDKLRELSRRSEQSQLAFVRAVGADTSDDENQLGDLVDDDQQQSMQMRQDLTAAKAARVRFTGESGEGATEGGARHADGGRGSQGKPLPASESSPAHVRQKGSASTAAGCCTATRRRKSRYVVDSSWFVWKASLMITSPLTLIGGWIAVVLVMVSSMYTAISVDAARSSLLHSYAAGASALRGQLELVLLIAEQRRVGAMSEARTNSTKILQSLGGVLNGAETTSFGVRLPGLAATKDPTTTRLFNILVHDSCLALPHGSYYWEQCRALHDEYGLRGLHSFTTAMLDDGVQARSIFNEFNASDVRTMPDLIVSGELFKIVPPLRRYDAKSRESEIIIRHLVNITADAAVNRLDETWGLVQIVLGAFSGIFVLIVWLWALPSVRRLEHTRRAHFTVLMSLPDDVITGTPAITKVLSDLATGTGLTQAARALAGLAKLSLGQSRRHVRAQSHARRKAHQVAPVADPTTIEEGPDDSRIDSVAGHADLGASPKAS
ncbi:tmcB, partial [Symbiodinium sp. KB8]